MIPHFLQEALLCAAVLADPSIDHATAARGCTLAGHAVEAALAHGVQPDLLLSVAMTESRWRTRAVNGLHCGAWQVRTYERGGWPYGLTCAELQQPQPGAQLGARRLRWFIRRSAGDIATALHRYAGCSADCPNYSDPILDRAKAWRRVIRLGDWYAR